MDNATIVLKYVSASQAIDYKNQVIARGLILNVDFMWKYQQIEGKGNSCVEFTFTDPKNATLFALIWP
jgi:hypothetical protein